MPMHTVDTRLSHLRCLQQAGWLSFDVTHMGEPDGYLLTPCCIHGYRGVYGPRPKLDSTRATTAMNIGSNPADPTPNAGFENVWQWSDIYGGDQAAYFVREQRLGNEGSWVLVAGARLGDDGMPFDAQAKWWVTTQSDASTLEEELVTTGENAYNIGFESGQQGGDYIGRQVRYRRSRNRDANFGSTHSVLRRWTKDNRAAGAAGLGARRWEDHHGGDIIDQGSGIEDPGLGEASGLPTLTGYGYGHRGDAPAGTSFGAFRADSIWWVLYGDRPFLGVTKCGDPIGGAQERDDHFHHGSGSNWRGLGVPEFDVNSIISPTASARGGYSPNIVFYGGDIQGASGKAICADDGDVTGVDMTDPGTTVISDAELTTYEAPQVTISMPNHYLGFNAKAKISTDPDEIKAAYPNMFKSLTEMQAELCDGYNDPIAQTFMVSPDRHPHGVFVPKIDVCFQSKPAYGGANLPVYLELRPTVNGYPHADKLIATVKKNIEDVKVASGFSRASGSILPTDDPMEISRTGLSEAGQGSIYPTFLDNDSEGNPNTSVTTFEFDIPQYLVPGEYAIVLRSNDSAYKCWISDTTAEVVGTASALERFEDDGYENITGSTMPQYGGVFFRSSNGRTWEPNQYQDLMFRVHQCKFSGATHSTALTGTTSVGGNAMGESTDFEYHRIGLDTFTSTRPTQTKIRSKLYTRRSTDSEVSFVSGYTGSIIDENEESIIRDLRVPMTYGKNKAAKDSDIRVDLTLSTNHDDVSPVINTQGFKAILLQNQIDGGGLGIDSIKLEDGGIGYQKNNTFKITGGGSTEDCTFKVTNINASGTILDGAIEIVSSGKNFHRRTDDNGVSDLKVSPVSVNGTGAKFEVLSEEGASDGNAKMKYVTKTVKLAPGMSARALRVYLTAREPYDSNIYVYYKVRADEDSQKIDGQSRRWKLMGRTSPDQDFFQSEVPNTAGVKVPWVSTEYQFDTDDVIEYSNIGGSETYNTFNSFAIKIVGFAGNAAQPPIIENFRAIAVF